jgi:hypothetical protein
LAFWALAGVGFVTLFGGWALSRNTAGFVWIAGSLAVAMLKYELRKDEPQDDEPSGDA